MNVKPTSNYIEEDISYDKMITHNMASSPMFYHTMIFLVSVWGFYQRMFGITQYCLFFFILSRNFKVGIEGTSKDLEEGGGLNFVKDLS